YKLFRNIIYRDIEWFDKKPTGEVYAYLDKHLNNIRYGISNKIPDFLTTLCYALGLIAFAVILGWKLALLSLSIAPLVIITVSVTGIVIVRYMEKELLVYSYAGNIAHEVLSAIRTVTAFNGQQREAERCG
ncbi:unnamed protein product, partial [Didymodactylos carnosus]